jgi:hypothetical protein
MHLTVIFASFRKGKKCEIDAAPFDVRFAKDPDFKKIDSVVQPDIAVICDPAKLDDNGALDRLI